MAKKKPREIIHGAIRYLANTYPFIRQDLYHETSERIACEILVAVSNLILFTTKQKKK